jgi:glycosyltransferase involved in cell wall biosynthesis
VKTVFVYPNPRRALAEAVARGDAPDSQLLGQNRLPGAVIYDPPLAGGSRATWLLREAVAPLTMPRADVVVSGLANVLPLALRVRRTPCVVVNYGLNATLRRASPARRRLLRASLDAAARIVSFGRAQSEDLASFVDAAKLAAVPFGIDERWWSPRNHTVEGGLVLAVGKDLARDYATFADAVRTLDVHGEIAALPRNLEGVSLPENASARWPSLTELRDLYARAGVVVIPQRAEDFLYGADGGITVLLEAMAMGRPVVATDRPMIREYVDDGVEALLVPPGDPAALRDAIVRALDRPELGAAGRARVEREYTSRHFAERLAAVLP